MRPLGTVLLTAALLATAACGTRTGGGSAGDGDDDGGTASETGTWHGCTAADVRRAGTPVGHGDLDHDGQTDEVRYVRAGEAPCPGLVAVTGSGVMGSGLAGLDVDPGSVHAIALHGTPGRVLFSVAERPHPRGGRQVHVFGSDGERLGEVTVHGQPLLPFFATDGGGTPVTVTCPSGGGVALVSARTHEPPGIVLAWDVTRTTYRIDGLRAVEERSPTLRTAVADPVLRKEMPHLFDGSFFAGCPVPAAR